MPVLTALEGLDILAVVAPDRAPMTILGPEIDGRPSASCVMARIDADLLSEAGPA